MSPRELPEKFGRYEVLEQIGEGSMGRVYRGFDPLVRRTVAIKTVRSEHLTQETAEEYLRRFRREAQAAGGLSHPHILSIFDVGEDYFVMELLEGTTLQHLLRERGSLPVPEALSVLGPVADALDYLHKIGIIHRDLKPANIMVLADGRSKLMDFGVAHVESSAMTADGEVFGSPSYMAPEQIAGGDVTSQADLFSLAVVTYEAVTGRKPFQAESITTVIYKVVNEDPPPPRQFNLDLPPRFDDIFRRALAKNPQERFATARDFIQALELKEVDSILASILPESPTLEPLETSPEIPPLVPAQEPWEAPGVRLPKPARQSFIPWVLGGVLAVAGAGGLLAFRVRHAVGEPSAHTGLSVETRPAGGSVFLDGKSVGTAPLTLEAVPPGSHTVKVTREGYAPAELTMDLVASSNLPPLRFALQPVSAQLEITSEPSAAAVEVDGKAMGQTPLTALRVEAGRHAVRVQREGFRGWTKDIDVHAGDSVRLPARLEREPEPQKRVVEATPLPSPSPLKEGDLVELGPGVTPPRKIAGEPVSYPPLAAKARMVGAVFVDLIVTETGEPADLRIIQSAGEILDSAVLEAVKGWRFVPAEKDGVKVRVHWTVIQRFERRS
jgi:TonB family protein